jgi:hypothetical protein
MVRTEKTSSKDKIESKYYNDLNSSEKSKVTFDFDPQMDESGDLPVSEYIISMKVTNNTDKKIQFDLSKFIVKIESYTQFSSSQSGTLTVSPGQTKNVNQLFENIGGQSLLDPLGEYLYLNRDNVLASVGDSGPAANQHTSIESNDSSSNSDNNDTDNSDDDSDYQALENSDDPGNRALAKVKKYFKDADTENPDFYGWRSGSDWHFSKGDGKAYIIYDNGQIQGPNDSKPYTPGK